MRLLNLSYEAHLTYCTNIHAGESWAEVRASLDTYLPSTKARISPNGPFGLGLRLSAIATEALNTAGALEEFRDFLSRNEIYVFTVNAFPYGPFHGRRVKEHVYQPDWLMRERVAYTDRAAEILAALLPAGMIGSVSTVPGTFKPIAAGRLDAAQAIAHMIVQHVAMLVELNRRTGREIVLALEPEPCCFLETVEETVAFFSDHLFGDETTNALAEKTGLDRASADEALRRHVGICYDVCHGAVEFEEPAAAFAAFERAGIRVAKLQLSSALRIPDVNRATAQSLMAFDDGVYLHQVVERRNGIITRYVDLKPALAALRDGNAGGEWRVHCHVPIFLEHAGCFHSTQATLKSALACARQRSVSPHLEVETYTWNVLPPELRRGNQADAIARELAWVIEELR